MSGLPFRLAMRSPERGADTLVWLSASVPGTDWQSGGYFADRKPATAKPDADVRNLAAELWDRSALMCGLQPSDAALPQPSGRLRQMQPMAGRRPGAGSIARAASCWRGLASGGGSLLS